MTLDKIFKAYDIRGVAGEEFDADISRRIGNAFARFSSAPTILVGRDMRTSSEELTNAFIEGVTATGVSVLNLGEVSTDLVYYASGARNMPGAMFTASHNPGQYNGIKLCGPKATPVGVDTGLGEIKAMASEAPKTSAETGSVTGADVLPEFASHLIAASGIGDVKGMKVAVDAANGMGGKVVPAVFGPLGIDLTELYFELDGTFPNHPADPIQPENLVDLQKAVIDSESVVGFAFDGDADRCFLVDEKAQGVSGSLTTALVAEAILADHPGAAVVYNVICSDVVRETIESNGGRGVLSRVGHSYIKQLMAEHDAVFGGEHSGHYYFSSNFRADSGLLCALYILRMISESGRGLSELIAPLDRYHASGEINSTVDSPDEKITAITNAYASDEQSTLDGLTVRGDGFWFNVRASNTEPLLRLNVEAVDPDTLQRVTDEVLELIR